MDSEELLAQLADIHLPEAVPFWAPAPGWWVLAVILLVLLIVGIRKINQQRRFQKIREFALNELENCYISFAESEQSDLNELKLRYANQFNSVLRRVAIYHYPNSNVASLSGQSWLDFITQSGDASLMNEDIAISLKESRFQLSCDVDVEKMHEFGRAWVASLYQQDDADTAESVSATEELGSNA